MSPTRSNLHLRSGGRPNPLRQLIAAKQRDAELASSQLKVEKMRSNLPSLISDQVDQHIERLEAQIVEDFKELGQKAAAKSAQALSEQLSGRLDTLEQMSALQSRSLQSLSTSSRIAEEKVGAVVTGVEKALSEAVPGGFQLDPPAQRSAPTRTEFVTELVKADSRELERAEHPGGKYVFCPACTSTKVRRAYRQGMWEEFLRLFFIAPFRCRSCRTKFYRF